MFPMPTALRHSSRTQLLFAGIVSLVLCTLWSQTQEAFGQNNYSPLASQVTTFPEDPDFNPSAYSPSYAPELPVRQYQPQQPAYPQQPRQEWSSPPIHSRPTRPEIPNFGSEYAPSYHPSSLPGPELPAYRPENSAPTSRPNWLVPTNYHAPYQNPLPELSIPNNSNRPYSNPNTLPAPPNYSVPNLAPQYSPNAPTQAPQYNEQFQQVQESISRRYTDPRVVRVAQNLSADQGIAFYREVSRLIDTRHLQPAAYPQRVRQGLLNLAMILDNPDFQQSMRIRMHPQQAQQLRQLLGQAQGTVQNIRTAEDASQLVYSTMNMARQFQLPAGVIAVEFVYASTETLDRYSAFEPSDNQSAEKEEEDRMATLDEQIVGIGVEIRAEPNGVVILKTLSGSPAAQAGLKAGDVIVGINGQPVLGVQLNQATDLISGPVGTPVMLTVRRGSMPGTLVTLTRQPIKVTTVSETRMLDRTQGIGYVKLERFGKSSSQELDQALWQLHQQGMRTLVFDVRGNPGGLLSTAIEVSNKFIPCGVIVSTKGRTATDNTQEVAQYQQTWKIPLVVLIDENSASASEIFAAAIQENQRGLVVGQKSYGKGTVQTHFPLQSVSGKLRLTTANFYSPNGRIMAGAGVTPDVPVSANQYTGPQVGLDAVISQAIAVARSPQLQQLAVAASRCRPTAAPDWQLGR